MMQYSYLVASRLTVVVATSVAVLMAQYTRLIEGTTLRLVINSSSGYFCSSIDGSVH